MGSELWIVDVDLIWSACFNSPFVFKIEIECFSLLLLFARPRVFSLHLLLDPGLESDMELPAAFLQFQSCQILLVGTLLIIKGEEQALVVHTHEVCLTVEHGRCWEIAVNLLLFLHELPFVWLIRKSNCIVDRKRTLNINNILILHQR